MSEGKFLDVFAESVRDVFRKPVVLVIGLLLFAYVTFLSEISVQVNYNLGNTLTITIWFVVFSLILLAGMSYVFSGLIGFAKEGKRFIFYGNRFWFRNFLIVLLITVIGILIGRVAHVASFYLGQILGLDVLVAQSVFILIYFAGLIGILIFFTFSSFFLILKDLSFKKSIKQSFGFVKGNYLSTLALSVIMFAVFFLSGRISGVVGDLVEYILLIPYFVYVLTKFVLAREK